MAEPGAQTEPGDNPSASIQTVGNKNSVPIDGEFLKFLSCD